MAKQKKKTEAAALNEPAKELADFIVTYFGTVESEGRPVPGLERIRALKASLDKQ